MVLFLYSKVFRMVHPLAKRDSSPAQVDDVLLEGVRQVVCVPSVDAVCAPGHHDVVLHVRRLRRFLPVDLYHIQY